ncbi:hypothetical protein HDU97_009712 [Phlyctochytrium planicorne]|nr:hypothetical protein HDU97_009712 [Phlyctochytrium planicorne]
MASAVNPLSSSSTSSSSSSSSSQHNTAPSASTSTSLLLLGNGTAFFLIAVACIAVIVFPMLVCGRKRKAAAAAANAAGIAPTATTSKKPFWKRNKEVYTGEGRGISIPREDEVVVRPPLPLEKPDTVVLVDAGTQADPPSDDEDILPSSSALLRMPTPSSSPLPSRYSPLPPHANGFPARHSPLPPRQYSPMPSLPTLQEETITLPPRASTPTFATAPHQHHQQQRRTSTTPTSSVFQQQQQQQLQQQQPQQSARSFIPISTRPPSQIRIPPIQDPTTVDLASPTPHSPAPSDCTLYEFNMSRQNSAISVRQPPMPSIPSQPAVSLGRMGRAMFEIHQGVSSNPTTPSSPAWSSGSAPSLVDEDAHAEEMHRDGVENAKNMMIEELPEPAIAVEAMDVKEDEDAYEEERYEDTENEEEIPTTLSTPAPSPLPPTNSTANSTAAAAIASLNILINQQQPSPTLTNTTLQYPSINNLRPRALSSLPSSTPPTSSSSSPTLRPSSSSSDLPSLSLSRFSNSRPSSIASSTNMPPTLVPHTKKRGRAGPLKEKRKTTRMSMLGEEFFAGMRKAEALDRKRSSTVGNGANNRMSIGSGLSAFGGGVGHDNGFKNELLMERRGSEPSRPSFTIGDEAAFTVRSSDDTAFMPDSPHQIPLHPFYEAENHMDHQKKRSSLFPTRTSRLSFSSNHQPQQQPITVASAQWTTPVPMSMEASSKSMPGQEIEKKQSRNRLKKLFSMSNLTIVTSSSNANNNVGKAVVDSPLSFKQPQMAEPLHESAFPRASAATAPIPIARSTSNNPATTTTSDLQAFLQWQDASPPSTPTSMQWSDLEVPIPSLSRSISSTTSKQQQQDPLSTTPPSTPPASPLAVPSTPSPRQPHRPLTSHDSPLHRFTPTPIRTPSLHKKMHKRIHRRTLSTASTLSAESWSTRDDEFRFSVGMRREEERSGWSVKVVGEEDGVSLRSFESAGGATVGSFVEEVVVVVEE